MGTRQIEHLAEACVGCGACAAVCPARCVVMREDAYGFSRPFVDEASCVGCGKCDRTCPVLGQRKLGEPISVLWAQALDDAILGRSSSGGLFSLLARHVIADGGGIVIGAAFDGSPKTVRHIIVEDMAGLVALRLSKYVQSEIPTETFEGARDALGAGRPVLFSGTACQIAGLRSYLGERAQNELLLCVEVACHGVPSPLLWRRWLDHVGGEHVSEVVSVNFRDKRTGWSSYSVSYRLASGRKVSHLASDDWYMRAFLQNASLRPSCLDCPSKGRSGSDVMLADFWGIRDPAASHPNTLGVSCVLINTDLGSRAVRDALETARWGVSSFEEALRSNPSLRSSAPAFSGYKEFMGLLESGEDCEELMREFPFDRPLHRRLLSHAAAFVRSRGRLR